jgi:hypothetical protein
MEESMKPLVVVLLVLVGIARGTGDEQSYNGYWWNDKTPQFKIGFASGYAMGMVDAKDLAGFKCIADKNGGRLPEKAPSNEVIDACLQDPWVKPMDYSNVRFGQLADGLDEFYKDFRNKEVDVQYALGYVRDELKGKPSDQLDQELRKLRVPCVQKKQQPLP